MAFSAYAQNKKLNLTSATSSSVFFIFFVVPARWAGTTDNRFLFISN